MSRMMLMCVVDEIDDDEAVKLKVKVDKLFAKIEGARIDLTLTSPLLLLSPSPSSSSEERE